MTARHGTLWIVKKDMLAEHEYKDYIGNRKVLLEKGEILEWRYESDNHFRTIDNKWFWVKDDVWEEYCLQIGKIHNDVCWKNRANTDDIWRLELFDWIQNGREVYDNIKKEIKTAGQITPPSAGAESTPTIADKQNPQTNDNMIVAD